MSSNRFWYQQLMCDGKLEFESREGGGTVARVTIP